MVFYRVVNYIQWPLSVPLMCVFCVLCFGCIILSRGEERRGAIRGHTRLWPQSADPPGVTSEKPHRCSAGDIWHLITGSKNRETRRVKGSVIRQVGGYPPVQRLASVSCAARSAVFRDTRQLSSDSHPARRHLAQASPALEEEHEFSWDGDEISESSEGPGVRDNCDNPHIGVTGASVTCLPSVTKLSDAPSVLWIRCHRTSLITINRLETSPLACESSD